jgi:eukaryotic-like serine/threonine-protein kinase
MIRAIRRYDVRAVLAERDGSVVYRALDPSLQRDVAITVITPAREGLLDDARALSKLGHSAIVPIYDVGTLDDSIFLVMPLVEGETLEEWARESRPWHEVARRFNAAGRGLAAAHAAGLIRDEFTAANVVLTKHEVLVTDVGLASAAEPVEAATLLSSFSTSFRAALRGTPPAWLSKALSDRWPSLTALLDHIDRRMARPRRLAIAASVAVVALVAVGGAYVATRTPSSDPCASTVAPLAAVWNDAIKSNIVAKVTATGSPMAQDALDRILPAFDRYSETWRAARIEVCRSPGASELVDRRISCIQQRLEHLRARTEAFASPDARLVQIAPEIAASMVPVAECADAAVLERTQPLPTDPAARKRLADLQRRIADLDMYGVRASPPEFLEMTKALVEDTAREDYLPAHVIALAMRARATSMARQPAEPLFRELAEVAARAKDDDHAAWAWLQLVTELTQRGRIEEAKKLEPVARATLQRSHKRASLMFSYEMALGGRAMNSGELEPALEHFRAALVAAEDRPDRRAGALKNVAYALASRGEAVEARAKIDEAVKVAAEAFGTHHPRYAEVLGYRGAILAEGRQPGDLDLAKADMENGIAIQTAIYGENHFDVLANVAVLADVELSREDYDAAEKQVRRGLAILDHVDAPLERPALMRKLGVITQERQGFAVARPIYESALAAAEPIFGKDSTDYTNIEYELAQGLSIEGDCGAARPIAQHILSFHESNKSPRVGHALFILGRCDVKEGRRAQGITRMSDAITRCSDGCPPAESAPYQRELGELLVETGHDATRGRELVAAARDAYRSIGDAARVAELDTWLAAHPQR